MCNKGSSSCIWPATMQCMMILAYSFWRDPSRENRMLINKYVKVINSGQKEFEVLNIQGLSENSWKNAYVEKLLLGFHFYTKVKFLVPFSMNSWSAVIQVQYSIRQQIFKGIVNRAEHLEEKAKEIILETDLCWGNTWWKQQKWGWRFLWKLITRIKERKNDKGKKYINRIIFYENIFHF